MDLLRRFDDGATLSGEELKSVRWLGVRPITEWAYRKVLLGRGVDGKDVSLWDHSYQLASLHKSVMAQALIEGRFRAPARLSWRILQVRFKRSVPEALGQVKELMEVEYPLGNELDRGEHTIHFTFPGLDDDSSARLCEELTEEIVFVVDRGLQPQVAVTPVTSALKQNAVWAAVAAL